MSEGRHLVRGWCTKSGLNAFILSMEINSSLVDLGRKLIGREIMLSSWFCGYVMLDKESQFFGKDYFNQELAGIEVHGGLTLSENGKGFEEFFLPVAEINISDQWILGFDCNHFDDLQDPKDLDYVIRECEKLAEQLKGGN